MPDAAVPVRHRHKGLGLALELPPAWTTSEGAGALALVCAEPADRHPPFRANVTVTIAPVLGDGSLEGHVDETLTSMARAMGDFQLIDRQLVALPCGAAERTVGHHEFHGQGVIADQWHVVRGERALTVTGSCWALDHDALADTFSSVADSLRLEDER